MCAVTRISLVIDMCETDVIGQSKNVCDPIVAGSKTSPQSPPDCVSRP